MSHLYTSFTSIFLFPSSAYPRPLHSFPTRRSSDLVFELRVYLLRLLTHRQELAAGAQGDQDLADANFRREHERSEEHTSELQSRQYLVCRLLLEKKKKKDAELRANFFLNLDLMVYA